MPKVATGARVCWCSPAWFKLLYDKLVLLIMSDRDQWQSDV
jgi:hypothetical protein